MNKSKRISYDVCVNYLYKLERRGIKYDLKNIKSLLSALNNPEKSFKSIHVAGTNGKGSVSSILNSYLIEKGFKTGLYTSPHISDFRERIIVNGKLISKKFIIDFVDDNHNLIEKVRPSFFEATTALAFAYFRYKKIEYAVVETGLGGRLDSTNVLNPVISVITGISVDHTDFLGKTIEKITAEKGGIIKNKRPVVAGRMSAGSIKILTSISKSKNSELICSDPRSLKIIKRNSGGIFFETKSSEYRKTKLFLPVPGDYQLYNAATSLSSATALEKYSDVKFSMKDLKSAFKNVKTNSNFHGRFELISKRPKIVIDISHNLQAVQNVKQNLRYFKFKKLLIIFGMMKDKNYKDSVNELAKLNADLILTKPDFPRAATPSELYEAILSKKKNHFVTDDVPDAFKLALSRSSPNDLILITGSFYLVGDFLKIKSV